jgi:ribonuclease P protein component
LRRAAGKGATNSRASSGRPLAGFAGAGPRSAMAGSRAGGRLTRRAEYDAVYRNGRRRSSRQFTVFFAANGLGESRFGMSVGRALGGAVVRNRIRRRVREVLRLHRVEIPSGWDIIVHPRASVAKAGFASLGDELLGLVRNSLPRSPVPQSGEKVCGDSRAKPEPGASGSGEPA